VVPLLSRKLWARTSWGKLGCLDLVASAKSAAAVKRLQKDTDLHYAAQGCVFFFYPSTSLYFFPPPGAVSSDTTKGAKEFPMLRHRSGALRG
jgi:hypothetical protein